MNHLPFGLRCIFVENSANLSFSITSINNQCFHVAFTLLCTFRDMGCTVGHGFQGMSPIWNILSLWSYKNVDTLVFYSRKSNISPDCRSIFHPCSDSNGSMPLYLFEVYMCAIQITLWKQVVYMVGCVIYFLKVHFINIYMQRKTEPHLGTLERQSQHGVWLLI